MMTDELILMLDKFEKGTGKAPTNEKLRREATDDWGADRHLEPNINRYRYDDRFMGIPIQVINNPNVLEYDNIYVLNEPDEDYYKFIYETQWWVRNTYNNLIVDDLVSPNGFERYYYGQ